MPEITLETVVEKIGLLSEETKRAEGELRESLRKYEDAAKRGGETSAELKTALDAADSRFKSLEAETKDAMQKFGELGGRIDELELNLKEASLSRGSKPAGPDLAERFINHLKSQANYQQLLTGDSKKSDAMRVEDLRGERFGRKEAVTTGMTTRFVPAQRLPMVEPDRYPLRVVDLLSHERAQAVAVEWIEYLGMGPDGGVAITSITRSGQTATVTISAGHGLTTGDRVQISGASQTEYNDTFYVSVSSATVFTVQVTGSPATPATGSPVMLTLTLGGNPTLVTETGISLETASRFILQTSNLKEIRHHAITTARVLQNVAGMRNFLDNELLYGLDFKLDRQALYGTGVDGSTPQLQGLLTHQLIQTYLWSSGANAAANSVADTRLDAVRRAMTPLNMIGRFPTAVLLHPRDCEKIDLLKDTQGRYIWASVPNGNGEMMWRVPVVETPALIEGTAAVGDWSAAATLFESNAAQILVGQPGDTFLRRELAIMAFWEGLIAVERPRAIVKITFDSAPS